MCLWKRGKEELASHTSVNVSSSKQHKEELVTSAVKPALRATSNSGLGLPEPVRSIEGKDFAHRSANTPPLLPHLQAEHHNMHQTSERTRFS